jgi:hypothetical protein
MRHLYLAIIAALVLAGIAWLNSTIGAHSVHHSGTTEAAPASVDEDYVEGLARYGIIKVPDHASHHAK